MDVFLEQFSTVSHPGRTFGPFLIPPSVSAPKWWPRALSFLSLCCLLQVFGHSLKGQILGVAFETLWDLNPEFSSLVRHFLAQLFDPQFTSIHTSLL